MNNVTITRQNGNVPKSLAGEDHVSGLLFYMPEGAVPSGLFIDHVAAIATIDEAEALGITADDEEWAIRVAHYQISEALRVNPGIEIYLGAWERPSTMTWDEITTMQQAADGRIRQLAIWDGTTAITTTAVAAIQGVADALDSTLAAPLIVGIAPKCPATGSILTTLAGSAPRVSVIIAQDADNELFADEDNASAKNAVSCIGLWLGHVSLASVHESISWVKKFPSGIGTPALSNGDKVRDVSRTVLNALDATGRYCFLVTITGITGSYWNDSNNLDAATSDYNAIELVRTMDKAVRGVRTYLTPELGGNVYFDPATGKMQTYTVEHLKTTAQKALEDMEKAGELSGYAVEIDPEQNVLSTSTVNVVIKNVPVGVVRRIAVKIGYVAAV